MLVDRNNSDRSQREDKHSCPGCNNFISCHLHGIIKIRNLKLDGDKNCFDNLQGLMFLSLCHVDLLS